MKPFLFVDFYKTISFGNFWHTVSEPLLRQIEELIFSNDARADISDEWMRGRMTSEEVNAYIAKNLDVEYGVIWDLFVRSAQTLGVNEKALDLITLLQNTYTTVLITDNMDSLNRFTIPAYKLDTVFEKVVNSAAVGVRKSDSNGDIFKLVTDDFSKSVLIDDTEHVCSIFTNLGGTAFKVMEKGDTEKHLQSLIASLK